MFTVQVIPGRRTTTVQITDVATLTDAQVLDVALWAARESRVRLFGWQVVRGSMAAVVHLHRD
jgi:hypothetical protein